MTIAEQLITIAENTPKVYEAGYEAGKAVNDDGSYREGYDEGYASGQTDGYNTGHEAGQKEGYESGQTDLYDSFWNTYQKNGGQTHYVYAFGGRNWKDGTFKPKYSMYPTNACEMFINTAIKYPFRMGAAEGETSNLVLDFKNCYDFTRTFYNSSVKELGVIDATKVNEPNFLEARFGLYETFALPNVSTKNLETIQELKVTKNTRFIDTFKACDSLKNLTITTTNAGGKIEDNGYYVTSDGSFRSGLNLKDCPNLTQSSIESVVNSLSDNSEEFTAILSSTAIKKIYGTSYVANNNPAQSLNKDISNIQYKTAGYNVLNNTTNIVSSQDIENNGKEQYINPERSTLVNPEDEVFPVTYGGPSIISGANYMHKLSFKNYDFEKGRKYLVIFNVYDKNSATGLESMPHWYNHIHFRTRDDYNDVEQMTNVAANNINAKIWAASSDHNYEAIQCAFVITGADAPKDVIVRHPSILVPTNLELNLCWENFAIIPFYKINFCDTNGDVQYTHQVLLQNKSGYRGIDTIASHYDLTNVPTEVYNIFNNTKGGWAINQGSYSTSRYIELNNKDISLYPAEQFPIKIYDINDPWLRIKNTKPNWNIVLA